MMLTHLAKGGLVKACLLLWGASVALAFIPAALRTAPQRAGSRLPPGLDGGCLFQPGRRGVQRLWAEAPASTTTAPASTPTALQPTRVQTLDYTTLLLLGRELSNVLLPSRLEHIIQSDDFTLLMQLRTLNGFQWLLISWQPESARVCLLEDAPAQPKGKAAAKSSYSLPSTLKSFIHNKMLIGVKLPLPGERILIFEFAERATDTVATVQLYVEIMGRRSNVMLVNPADSNVLACGYQVSPSKSVRAVSVGQSYSLPPSLLNPMPSTTTTPWPEFLPRASLNPTHDLRKALLSAFRGFSPQLIYTLAAAAGLDSAAKVGEIGEEGLRRLYDLAVTPWLGVLEGQACQSALSKDLSRYTPVLLPQAGTEGWQAVDSINAVVDRYYTSCLRRRDFAELHQRCLSRIYNVLSRLQRTRDEFQQQLTEAGEENLGALQARAELLTTYAYSWREGDTRLHGFDLQTGEPLVLELKEGMSAADEAQECYKRIRKLRRSIQAVKPLLEQMDVKLAFVEEMENSVLQLGSNLATLDRDLELLCEIAEELGVDPVRGGGGTPRSTFFSNILSKLGPAGGEPQADAQGKGKKDNKGNNKGGKKGGQGGGGKQAQAQQGQGKGAQAGGSQIQSFRRPERRECLVYVGRNSKQNDAISFSMAKSTDLWFHARGVPGAHVLLRLDAGSEVGDEDLQFAADLAAFFSKGRGSRDVPVQWTYGKHLKRMPGGGPGMVQVMKENKVLWGKPESGEEIVAAADDTPPTATQGDK